MSAHLIPQEVVPIGTGYLILMGVLAAGLRLQRRTPAGPRAGAAADAAADPAADAAAGKVPGRAARRLPPGWPRFLLQVAATALGGYLVLQAAGVGRQLRGAQGARPVPVCAFARPPLPPRLSLPALPARTW